MQAGFVQDKPLGHAQAAAGAIDTATFISTLTFGSAGAAGIPSGTQLLLLQPATQSIRWRDDGVAPTTTVGYPLAAGAELRYTGATGRLQVISATPGAVLNVVAYGTGTP